MKSKTEQTPLTLADLTARNTEALRRVADLKADRTAAMLDGTAFDATDLRAALDDAGAVADALAEFSRREAARAAAEAVALASMTEAEKREKARALIMQLAGDRSAAIADMESHTRAMMDAYKRAEQARGQLQSTLYAHVRVTPVDLMANAQESRLSAAMSAVLARGVGGGNFGETSLHWGARDPDQSWLVAEKSVADAVTSALTALGGADLKPKEGM
jgi:hypothetical protein